MKALIAAAMVTTSQAGPPPSKIDALTVRPYETDQARGCRLEARIGQRIVALETSVRKHWRPEATLLVSGVEAPSSAGSRLPAVLGLTYRIGDQATESRNRLGAEWVGEGDRKALHVESVQGLLQPASARLNGQSYVLNYERFAVAIDGQTLVEVDADAKFHTAIKELNACTQKQEPFDPFPSG